MEKQDEKNILDAGNIMRKCTEARNSETVPWIWGNHCAAKAEIV